MNERIQKLREASLEARPSLSAERALLMTEFHRNTDTASLSVPMRRALAFRHLLEHKTIVIGEGELIVGERGPAPKAAPTYPEINTHSLEDLDILDGRPRTSFRVSPETRRAYEEIVIPFWRGRTIREKIFAAMEPAWLAAYEAGVFTEFMEQRAPGHTALDGKIYERGFEDFKRDIRRSIGWLDLAGDPAAAGKREELEAMAAAADAIMLFADRHAARARELASSETRPARRRELLLIAEVCGRVPRLAPRDFREALQAYWFVHLGVITELNTWDSFNPGRLDQHLWPFYKKGLEDGSLTEESARELLQAFWIKFNNQPAPPKVGVTAEESGTYTDFCLINLGGVRPDGSDASNELSFLLLDVIEEMRLLQPSSMLQVSRQSPDRLLDRALKIIKTGFGQPSLFNTEAIVEEMLRQGKSLEDARSGGASGCVEAGIFGKENYNLTGYFNLPKVLEIALHDGVDPMTGQRLGPATGRPASFANYDELFAAFRRQIEHFVDIKVLGNAAVERLYARCLPAPFLSILIDDCIAKGRDYHDGGAKYNTSYIQGVGIGTAADSLASLRYHVYDGKDLTMPELMTALDSNFEGREALRRRLVDRTPKYGNDDGYADGIAAEVFEAYFGSVDGRTNERGGRYRINLLPTTVHIYFGRVTGALPDGRRASEPLSEGISPVQGADRRGPTAVVKSAARIDHLRTGGTLLNQKFTPELLATESGMAKLRHLVRGYFRLMGHHIQFNVVTAATLREARRHPERYRDLIVRVAGYSDYFVDLGPELQEEIISRTEQSRD